MDDFVEILIYIALGLIGVVASAYKNKKKQAQRPVPRQQAPRPEVQANPQPDFGPELGPLLEMFDIPYKKKEEPVYETIESGPSVEEDGMDFDTAESTLEWTGSRDAAIAKTETTESLDQYTGEGVSEIQKMIDRYNKLKAENPNLEYGDEISAGEIVSEEVLEERRLAEVVDLDSFNAKKAIIYSEILKRREF